MSGFCYLSGKGEVVFDSCLFIDLFAGLFQAAELGEFLLRRSGRTLVAGKTGGV